MATPLRPPRMTGDPQVDLAGSIEYLWVWYRAIIEEQEFVKNSDIGVTVAPASGGAATGTGLAVKQDAPTLNNPIFVNPALGTPASGVATNLTGTAAGLTAGHVTTNANLTGPITSSGNATAVASQTGTGTKFVMDDTPTLITPILGAATATSLACGVAGFSGTIGSTKSGQVLDHIVAATTVQYCSMRSTGGNTAWGCASSTGSGFGGAVDAYSAVFGSFTAVPVFISANSTVVAKFDVAAVTVTGTFSASSNITSGGIITCGQVNVADSAEPGNGIYLQAANTLGFTSATTLRATINATRMDVLVPLRTPGGASMLVTAAALTDGAGAGLGTLTNAPAAGNPTKWVAINDAGTLRYYPTWTP